jgi:hypothetical protein
MMVDVRRSGPVWLVALAALAIGACAAGTARRTREEPRPAPVTEVLVSTAESASTAPQLATADAAPVVEQRTAHRITLALGPAAKPCTLVIRSDAFEDAADHWMLHSIRYLASEQSAGCSSGVLFDASVEVVPEGQEAPEALEAGVIIKPGAKLTPDELPQGGVLADYDFDGQLDLCVTELFGAYNFSQRCWIFDKGQRRFVRNAELESMQQIEIDAGKKLLSSSWRVGGPVYTAVQKRWIDGQLATVREVLTHLGETPNGKPLPPGKSSWEVVYERRGGKLVKLSEGPR